MSDDPWKQKAVLSFDGGGVRGFASLLALKKLMDEIKKIEENHPYGIHTSSFDVQAERGSEELFMGPTRGFWPCHYFDYMFGTSTGGLNSIMLGRLRMNVDVCIHEYPEISEAIFSNPAGKVKRFFRGHKYKSKPFEAKVRDLVERNCPDDRSNAAWNRYPSPPYLCRTVVVSNRIEGTRGVTSKICYFRTFDYAKLDEEQDHGNPQAPNGEATKQQAIEHELVDRQSGYDPATDCEIWQAARATSAAPSYFKEIEINDVSYSDGGMGCNNPAGAACVHLWNMERSCPWTIVSIGTGEKLPSSSRNAVLKASKKSASAKVLKAATDLKPVKRLKSWALQGAEKLTSTDPGAEHALHLMEVGKRKEGYFRWDLGPDLAVMKLDEWKPKSKTRVMSSADWAAKCVDDYMSNRQN